jgi:large subunit ribosomal protein L22
MTQVKAQLNGLRISPRKVRLLASLIRGKSVEIAMDQLAHFVKRSSPQLTKLMLSAIANAENNYKMDRSTLVIADIQVDEGIKLKRFRPKGFGRANPIHKKTSRVRVVLEDRLPKAEVAKAPKKKAAPKKKTVTKASTTN